MRVLVCGSRMFALDGDADGKSIVWERLSRLKDEPQDVHLVLGGARGPDEWAREWAVGYCVDHTVMYAHWRAHGKKAGILRNIAMLDTKPDLVLAFWDGESTGTGHTIFEAHRRLIAVEITRDV